MSLSPATACAIACASVLAADCQAAVVHFTNPAPGQPGHYDWRFTPNGAPNWLDITLAPSQQTGVSNGSSVSQLSDAFGNMHDAGTPASAAWVFATTLGFAWTAPLHSGWVLATGTGDMDWLPSAIHSSAGQSFFPDNARRYMGVRTAAGQYGWVEVQRSGDSLTAFAWAYETQPGVPIVTGEVPAPGVGVVLAVGVVGAVGRRRGRGPRC